MAAQLNTSTKKTRFRKLIDYIFDKFSLLIAMLAGMFILGLIIMYLWNFLFPDIFGWPVITYWQGFAIGVLSRILFGFD